MSNPEENPKVPAADEARPGCMEKVSNRVHSALEGFFYALARIVVNHPGITIGAILLLTVILAQGYWFFEEELSGERQFVPQGSRAIKEQHYIEDVYGYQNRAVVAYFEARARDGEGEPNILTKERLRHLFTFRQYLEEGVEVEVDGEQVNYQTICARYTADSACKVPLSLLALWGDNITRFEQDADILQTINAEGAWRSVQSTGPDLDYYLGGLRTEGGVIVGATATRMSYELRNKREEHSGIGLEDMQSRKFEIELAESTRRDRSSAEASGVYIGITTAGEQQYRYEESMESDVNALIFGYIMMLLYTSFVLFRGLLKESHAILGIASVFAVGMSTLSAYGFCWFIGVKFNTIVQVLIVVLLGVGVDDTFVIMDSWFELEKITDLKERMEKALGHAGTALTVTSMTDLIAFLAGSASSFPAIRDFCYYAAVGITFIFIYQCTLFVAMAYFDTLREKKSRMDCLCCVRVEDGTGCWINGPPCVSPAVGKRGLMRHAVGVAFPRLMLGSVVGKAVTAGIVAIVLGLGAYGCTEARMNYDIEWFVPDGDDLAKDYELRDQHFESRGGVFYLYFRGVDFTSPEGQDLVRASSSMINQVNCVVRGSVISWQEALIQWLQREGRNETLVTNNEQVYVRPDAYARVLREFASITGPSTGRVEIDNLRWDGANLVAARASFAVSNGPLEEGEEAVECLDDLRDQLETAMEQSTITEGRSGEEEVFVWSPTVLFWESFQVMIPEITQNVGVAGTCVLILVALITANIYIGLIVGLIIGAVDTCLLGFMPFLGIDLHSVSLVCIVVAIGFAVDYSAHIAHAFLLAKAEDTEFASARSQRAAYALWKMGPAVFNGATSTFIALLPLSMAVSFAFRTFFVMFYLIIIFGLFFGFVALPLLLSVAGPVPLSDAVDLSANPWMNPLDPKFEEPHPEEPASEKDTAMVEVIEKQSE